MFSEREIERNMLTWLRLIWLGLIWLGLIWLGLIRLGDQITRMICVYSTWAQMARDHLTQDHMARSGSLWLARAHVFEFIWLRLIKPCMARAHIVIESNSYGLGEWASGLNCLGSYCLLSHSSGSQASSSYSSVFRLFVNILYFQKVFKQNKTIKLKKKKVKMEFGLI